MEVKVLTTGRTLVYVEVLVEIDDWVTEFLRSVMKFQAPTKHIGTKLA